MDLARNKVHIIGAWPAVAEQGRIAALNMTGAESRYPGSIWTNSINTNAFHLVTAGVLKGKPGLTVYEKYIPSRKQFRRIVLRGDVPVGMAFYNCSEEAGLFFNLMKKATPLTVDPEKIVNGDVNIREIRIPAMNKL